MLWQFREVLGAEGRASAITHYRNASEIFEGMQAAGVLPPVDVKLIAAFKAELEGR